MGVNPFMGQCQRRESHREEERERREREGKRERKRESQRENQTRERESQTREPILYQTTEVRGVRHRRGNGRYGLGRGDSSLPVD